MTELSDILRELNSPAPGRCVLATLVRVAGSSYRRPGSRLLLAADGRRHGSISGGCLEEDVLIRARRVAATGVPDLVTYDTTSENDLVWGVGLGCHGVVDVLIESVEPHPAWAIALANRQTAHLPTDLAVIWQTAEGAALGTRLACEVSAAALSAPGTFRQLVPPPPHLAIFGAGDDAQPLVRLAAELGWRVTVADPRPAFATTERFPPATVLSGPAEELVARATLPSDALAVVMTHHYVHDLPVLRSLLPLHLPYVGLLGPRKRAERLLADLARDGFTLTADQRACLHAPVGLDLGAETPAEVALAIVAEIRSSLAGRDARPLRERDRPIHG